MRDEIGWAATAMRAGYVGRGLVYLVVAGFSLWAIWHGGEAQGTGSALARLEHSAWGLVVLTAIALGLLAYAVWRAADAWWDLDDKGSDAKGIAARTGIAVTALVHLGLAVTAATILLTPSGGGGDATLVRWTGRVMAWPFGRWLVALGGAAVIGAGLYYGWQAWSRSYRDKLRANRFTLRWSPVLEAGVAAHAVVLVLIGAFFVWAAWTADPSEAGGTDKAFAWISGQIYGQVLVTLVCVGLAAFALFLFVNAGWRVVPRAPGGADAETLAARLRAMAR